MGRGEADEKYTRSFQLREGDLKKFSVLWLFLCSQTGVQGAGVSGLVYHWGAA